ncbi:MAG: Crp/Fnr family transcriptional regulator [Fimbriimonas sp.]|nr:Crp/Fnr family transcriptional regulator [Fimbriimonas sp.]
MEREERLIEAIRFMRETGSWREPSVLLGTGYASRARGDLSGARKWFQSGIDFDSRGNVSAGANHLALAEVAFLEGSYLESARLWRDMFVVHSDLRFWNEATYCAMGLAACATRLGYPEIGLRFEGFAKSLSKRMLVPPSPFESEWTPAYLEARLVVGSDAERLVRAGASVSHDTAIGEIAGWQPKTESSRIARRLRSFPLMAPIERTEMQAVVSACKIERFPPGSLVVASGQISDGSLRLVLGGQVARRTAQGDVPIGDKEPILDGVFLKGSSLYDTLVASESAEVALVDAETIEAVAGLRRLVVSALAVRAQHSAGSLGKLDDRLLLFARSHVAGGVGTFRVPLTQNELATRFGVTRESVGRALSRLEGKGLIIRHKNSRWTVR